MVTTKTFSPANIDRKELTMDIDRYVRGGLWWYMDNIADKTRGERGITRGDRPILIISNVSNTTETCTITYLPISKMSASASQGPNKLKEFHAVPITIPGGRDSYVVCNQPTTGVTNHLKGYIGQIKPGKMKEIENELLKYMGMVVQSIEHNTDTAKDAGTPSELQEEPNLTSEHKKPNESLEVKKPVTQSKAARHSRCIKVRCIETDKVYECMADAARELNVHVSYISKAISGKIKNPIRHFELV